MAAVAGRTVNILVASELIHGPEAVVVEAADP
jgi:hypothetical protein